MKREIQFEDFRLALLAVWRNKTLILFVTLAGLFAGLLYTSIKTESSLYMAGSSVYCASYNISSTTKIASYDTSLVINYTDVIKSRKVCEYAASLISEMNLSADDIQNMITLKASTTSYVISIYAYSSNSEVSIKVANAVAEAFVSEMSNITENESVHILDVADTVSQVQNSTTNLLRLIFTGGAFVLALGTIVIKSLLSDKICSITQCVEDEDEILGIVPEMY